MCWQSLTKRRVRDQLDSLGLAVRLELVRRKARMEFDLVDRRHDSRVRQELLQSFDREVGDTDTLHFTYGLVLVMIVVICTIRVNLSRGVSPWLSTCQ